jgi:hypothetical protein
MVTLAQAQERAEEWINGEVPAYQHREVRVREFELGFVVWAEDRPEGPRSDGGRQRMVIARDSGEATLWPGLPVGEVIRRYEEEYGRDESGGAPAAPPPPERIDLNQTSFLLSPPQWLQDAADRLGIPDRRGERSSGGGTGAGADSGVSGGSPGSGGSEGTSPAGPVAPPGATPWTGTDTNADAGDDRSVPLPDTVYAPQLSEEPGNGPSAGGSPSVPPASSSPSASPASYAADIADAATSKAPPPRAARGNGTPPPPGTPGTPGARPGAGTPPPPGPPGAPGASSSDSSGGGSLGYVPTQLVSSLGPEGP